MKAGQSQRRQRNFVKRPPPRSSSSMSSPSPSSSSSSSAASSEYEPWAAAASSAPRGCSHNNNTLSLGISYTATATNNNHGKNSNHINKITSSSSPPASLSSTTGTRRSSSSMAPGGDNSNNNSSTAASNDAIIRGAAKKLASFTAAGADRLSATVGDRKILLGLFALFASVMLAIDAAGLAFTVQRMFQGDSKTLLAAFSIAMGVNASQIFALLSRLLMLQLGDFERRELVLRQTTLFRGFLAFGSVVVVCVLLAGLFVAPTEDYASNINPQLAGCSSLGCATVMAVVGLVLNAANVCWLLSTMFMLPTSAWYRWHNGLSSSSTSSSPTQPCNIC